MKLNFAATHPKRVRILAKGNEGAKDEHAATTESSATIHSRNRCS
jgi:hypothetical protein